MRGAWAAALLFTLACGDPRTRTVHPQLMPPENTLDFGLVPVLNEKLAQVQVLNVGRAVLNVSAVRFKADPGPFTLKAVPDAVESGGTKTIDIGFVPPLEGTYGATVVFETDDTDNPLIEVALTGQGSTRAVMQLEPTALDFGRVAECTSAVKTLTIRSAGTADLIVEEIAFTDDTSPAFGFVGSTRTPAVAAAMSENGLPGQLQLTLKVTVAAGTEGPLSGGIRVRGTDPDQREVVVPLSAAVNRAPVPVIKPPGVGAPGMSVTLDGSDSSDSDADLPLAYKWTLRQKPLGAATSLSALDQALTSMTLDPALPGAYEVELSVTDAAGAKACTPARATVVASPAQKLLVEMFWDNAKTDIDLHVLRTPTSPVGTAPDDCYYANPTPDWGLAGDATDDPQFLRDALTGYGPEVFGYVSPAEGTYRIAVEFANDHLDTHPATGVTVRVYEFGVVQGEFRKTMQSTGEFWSVADVAWPSGDVTALQQ